MNLQNLNRILKLFLTALAVFFYYQISAILKKQNSVSEKIEKKIVHQNSSWNSRRNEKKTSRETKRSKRLLFVCYWIKNYLIKYFLTQHFLISLIEWKKIKEWMNGKDIATNKYQRSKKKTILKFTNALWRKHIIFYFIDSESFTYEGHVLAFLSKYLSTTIEGNSYLCFFVIKININLNEDLCCCEWKTRRQWRVRMKYKKIYIMCSCFIIEHKHKYSSKDFFKRTINNLCIQF